MKIQIQIEINVSKSFILAQKFKFTICYFSENLIFGHTFRFSNSVIYKLNKMSKPLFNKWSSKLVRHKMIDCSWGCCQICLKQSWIDKCCSKTTLRLMNLFLFLLRIKSIIPNPKNLDTSKISKEENAKRSKSMIFALLVNGH